MASFGPAAFALDPAPHFWPYAVRTSNCASSWWDIPRLNIGFVPMTWSIQELNYPESNPWVVGRGECALDVDSTLPSYVPDNYRFSSIDPVMLNGGYSLASVQPENSDLPASADEVPPEVTSISGSEAARALRRAWKSAMQRWPSQDVVLVLAAHWAHETHGGRLMFNYNFGGIKGRGPDGLSCVREAHEGAGYHVRALVDRFRAYHDAKQGAEDYLSLLIRKYPRAVDAAQRGDVTDFVSALKIGGYFTGSEAAYARSLSDLVQRAFEQGFDSLSRLPAGG